LANSWQRSTDNVINWPHGATFGDGGTSSYTQVDSSGHLSLHGEAVVWDDQQVNLGTVAKGVSAPTTQAYKNSQVLSFSASQDNRVMFNMQFSHKLKLNTAIEQHLHDTVPDNNAGLVAWKLTVSKADLGSTFPDETTYDSVQTIAANSLDMHLLHELTSDIGASSDVSAIAMCSLTRVGTSTDDTYAAAVYLTAIDSHFQIDTIGSNGETSK